MCSSDVSWGFFFVTHDRIRLFITNLSACIHGNRAVARSHLDVLLFQVTQLFLSEGQRSSNYRQDPEHIIQTLLDTQPGVDL